MITEDYVSFEVAKLLKEKGFNTDISIPHAVYSLNDGTFINLLQFIGNTSFINYNLEKCVVAPTLQMAMKWLREVHDLIIYVKLINDEDLCHDTWGFVIYNKFTNEYIKSDKLWFKYEEATEAGIKYCLENLI